jgi:hypothetical protein
VSAPGSWDTGVEREAVSESSKVSTEKSLQELVSELWALVVRYAKQETLDPMKSLWRFLAWGLLGSVFLALGFVLVGVAVLRALQLELSPHLSGDLSWVPYLGPIGLSVVVIALLVRAIGSERRRVERERAALRRERG